ncbi:MAG: hypothetical protein IKE69_02115 [Thermoguttaceae bacterium]|nr:hypothetical protein [Thermoguttaceae bacterium]
MGPELEGERPASADFDKLAQNAYNKQAREKGWKRRFDDLSPSTRLKYYYQAQKDYEKRTGKPAYSQVKGDTTFKDYFEKQDEAFQRSWLGPKRFALYQQGKYDPLHLANPDTGYVATLDELFVGPAYDSIPEGATSNNPLSPDEPILKRRRKQESSGPVPGEAHIPYLSEAKRIIAEIDQSEVIVAYNEEIKRLQREVNLAEAKLKNSTGHNKEESEKDLATKRDELQKIINGRNIARRNEAIRRFLPEDNPDSPTRQSARKIKFEGVPEADHREALDFVARLLDNTAYRNIPMEEIVVRHTFEVRSYTFDKEIFLSDFLRKTTMHHETGHTQLRMWSRQ